MQSDLGQDFLRSWNTLSRVVVGALALALVAVVVAEATVFRSDRTARAEVGQVLQLSRLDPALAGRSVTVAVPAGSIRLTVGEVRERLLRSDEDDSRGALVRPPEDGSFVPLAWELVDTAAGVPAPVSVTLGPVPDVSVSLVVGGEVYPVGIDGRDTAGIFLSDAYGKDATVAVAVPGEPSAVTVVVGYDGEEQRFDFQDGAPVGTPDLGRFEGVAPVSGKDLRAPLSLPVGYRGDGLGGSRAEMLRVSTVSAPYVRGLGWAADGYRWLAVTFDLKYGLPDITRGSAQYRPQAGIDPARVDGRLGGRKPAYRAVVPSSPDDDVDALDSDSDLLLVFEVPETGPPGALRVVADAPILYVFEDGGARTPDEVRFAWQVQVPAVTA